jgi:hypothetical protein
MNSIEYFNNVRRILFSTFHKGEKEQELAFQYLEGYKNKLGLKAYTGLSAELGFYRRYRKEFALSVAADVGDHTDFSGQLAGNIFRFDVTTNADYKELIKYEPLQRGIDAKYKIALVDIHGNLEELIDINFPFCPECEQGRLIDTVVLLGENFNDDGESRWTNDQVLIGICNHCQYYDDIDRISMHFLNDFATEIDNAWSAEKDSADMQESFHQKSPFDEHDIVRKHSEHAIPYFQKQFDRSIMALGEKKYEITNSSDGDGYHCLKIRWKKDLLLLDDYILDEYEVDIY